MAAADLVALYKEMYENEIKVTYQNLGMLRSLVKNEADAEGISRHFPLIGRQLSYRRIGTEYITPNQPITGSVLMTFLNPETSSDLGIFEEYKIENGTYIPTLVRQQANSLTTDIEQIIIDAFSAIPTVDSNTINFDQIESGYRINGDGTAYTLPAAESIVTIRGLNQIKIMFDDLGIPEDERWVYLPANAVVGLLNGPDKDQFTNSFYSGQTQLAYSGIKYSAVLGLNIIQAQGNPLGGLPKYSSATTEGTYGFAFTSDTVQFNATPIRTTMDFFIQKQAWNFVANLRCGAAGVRPGTFIKIACKTFV